MALPKPVAPSKPLTFTPPKFLKGETKSSELPFVEGAEVPVMERKRPARKPFKKNKANHKGARPNIAIIDEAVRLTGVVEINLGEVEAATALKQLIGTPSNPKKATDEKPKKPFVLDEHLTQRPFKDDRLMQLKASLQRNS
jgi:hypothetical protein